MPSIREGSVYAAFGTALLVAACTAYSDGTPDDGVDTPVGGDGGGGKANIAGKSGTGGTINLEMGGCGSDGCEGEEMPEPGVEAFCSDGRHDPGEACDDGNVESGDGCTATCAQVEGDFVCPTPGEECVSTQKCGDKKVSSLETCDDGQANPQAGDGCDAQCLIETGWLCPIIGEPCVAAACGDGIVAGLETCEDDDATPAGGDGCSATCQVEPGYVCKTAGEKCDPTVCNDGTKEGTEPCDDGNQIVGDGCTPLCQVEPDCPNTGGACSSLCGDGLILPTDNEQCDDGNTIDGDGCSATCTQELGYVCSLVQSALPPSIQIPFVYRDFVSVPASANPTATDATRLIPVVPRHPDFNGGCRGALVEGVVDPVLDAQGKPVNSGLCDLPVSCTVNLNYSPGAVGEPSTGDYCQRRDDCAGEAPTGCLGITHANHPLASHPADDPFKFWFRDTPGVNHTLVVPVTLNKNAQNVYTFNDPAGGLFPFDGAGFTAANQELTFSIGFDPPLHNYGFTTEVRYYFQFAGGETLNFSGDDDVWVFVNGHLALDMGGKHGLANRTVVLNANGTATCATCTSVANPNGTTFDLDITAGNVYEIALFHAERQTAASNFNLSLTGFVDKKSSCKSVCGDGVVTPDEECDQGEANGSNAYNGCTAQCKRGAFCGDGQVQSPDEDCDDSVNLSQYGGCAPGCQAGPFCGDGSVQSQFEECDDGSLLGDYGGCSPGCVLGPRCGDGVEQDEAGETCDDGNRKNLDGCSANCKIEDVK